MSMSARCVAAVIVLSGFVMLPVSYCSSSPAIAAVNEHGTIVVFKTEDSTSPFESIFPENGTINGRKISKLSPTGMNVHGQVVGLVTAEAEARFPFVREPDGRFWLFMTPSPSGQGEFTDISDSGKAVGVYEKEGSAAKLGFMMDSNGQWVMDIQYPSNPCPASRSHLHTQPNGINDRDEIVGNFECTALPGDADPLFRGQGFYRAPDGTFYRLQYENAVRTVAGKISNTGVIFGYYVLDEDTWLPFAAPKDDLIREVIR